MQAVVEEAHKQLLAHAIDLTKCSLKLSLLSIVFNPTFWNIAARLEFHYKILTKLAGGNARLGCYILALTIFSLGIFRDYLYEKALREQEVYAALDNALYKYIGVACFAVGNVLVLSSMWALGVTGTYLGDYFGILMDHKVESFPFNVSNNPMYQGSTLSFVGTALYFGKPAGLLVSAVVYVMYAIALQFEEPFTAWIYAQREEKRKRQ